MKALKIAGIILASCSASYIVGTLMGIGTVNCIVDVLTED